MKRDKEKLAKGIVLGAVAMTALGATGAYLVNENKRQVKKTAKKVAQTAERTVEGIEQFVRNNF